MKLEELKVGQVVQLNSGGPRMTISSITDENNIECVYFDSRDCKCHYEKLNACVLILA